MRLRGGASVSGSVDGDEVDAQAAQDSVVRVGDRGIESGAGMPVEVQHYGPLAVAVVADAEPSAVRQSDLFVGGGPRYGHGPAGFPLVKASPATVRASS